MKSEDYLSKISYPHHVYKCRKGYMDRQFESTIEKEFFSNIIVNTIDVLGQFITCQCVYAVCMCVYERFKSGESTLLDLGFEGDGLTLLGPKGERGVTSLGEGTSREGVQDPWQRETGSAIILSLPPIIRYSFLPPTHCGSILIHLFSSRCNPIPITLFACSLSAVLYHFIHLILSFSLVVISYLYYLRSLFFSHYISPPRCLFFSILLNGYY